MQVFCKMCGNTYWFGIQSVAKRGNEPFNNIIPEQEEKPSAAQIKVLKDIALKPKLNLDYWIKNNGKTWESLSANDVANMLIAIKEKYGEE